MLYMPLFPWTLVRYRRMNYCWEIDADQLDQATNHERRRMKQAEQAKAFPENMMPVEKPDSCACITRKSLLCNMSFCLLLPISLS